MSTLGTETQREVRAAGAVLWRPAESGELEVALVHRPRYDDWSLPKGKLDRGETVPAAAAREVTEETGFACVLGPFLAEVRYALAGQPAAEKTVGYFSARATGGEFTPNREVDQLRWLPLPQARDLLDYQRDAEVLDEFTALGTDLTTVLLLRHALAGERDEWVGDDHLRPLTEDGVRQADLLRRMLLLFGPDEVYSAPRVRCLQTVTPLAGELGTEVVQEPLLSEEGYLEDPALGLRRLLEIVRDDGTPVISSQGGVIPQMVGTLAEQEGIRLTEVPAAKGSVWLLAFRRAADGPRLAAAHYLPAAAADDA